MSGPLHQLRTRIALQWAKVDPRFLPFADAATAELPLGRLLRLSLFQVSVGMAVVLLIGTLNRVMIVELGVPSWLVAVMIALPVLVAPFRAVIGFRSDTHTSALGWRRVPYLWMGTMVQFGGLSIMPFALIVLSGDADAPAWVGKAAAALAFLMVGAGLHAVQTVGLALATDLAPERTHPRVVAFLCMMLLLGMLGSGAIFGLALAEFSQLRLIQVIQATAVATMALNIVALWKQEPRDPSRTRRHVRQPRFAEAWAGFIAAAGRDGRPLRSLCALGIGTVAFSMQDVLLEPYGGQVLGLSVGATTALSAVFAAGGLCGFAVGAQRLGLGADPYRYAGLSALAGMIGFSLVIFAGPLLSTALFATGTVLIGFGAGLFGHCTLTAAMGTARGGPIGLALGIWGAVQATAAGAAVAAGGLIRDGFGGLAESGALGAALQSPVTGYSLVYHIEIALLFATLIAVGPLVRRRPVHPAADADAYGLAGQSGYRTSDA